MKSCCSSTTNKDKQCVRKSDKKIFSLPRRFSKKRCQEGIKGFTMRSSCAPYKDCLTKQTKRTNRKKIKGGNKKSKKKTTYKKNILNEPLQLCSTQPMTGFYRDGYCMTGSEDKGTHTVCATMDKQFLDYTAKKGNDLSSVVKPGDSWCLCEYRWKQAYEDGKAPSVNKDATNMRTKKSIRKMIQKHSKVVKKIAYFAGGCFWGLESKFKQVEGVLDTEVGYMGGIRSNGKYTKKNVTYEQVCSGNTGHAETVKVVYNSNKISFSDLVDLFFSFHDPTTRNKQGPDMGTQYRSIAFYSTKQEKQMIQRYIQQSSKNIVTEVKKKTTFHKAEEYYQNYNEKKQCDNPKTENESVFRKICQNNSQLAEPKFSGKYTQKPYVDGTNKGMYVCPCCENPLYSSRDAFDSNSGWPAFSDTIDKKGLSVSKHINYNTLTKELTCKRCGVHLGHRFIKGNKIHDCVNSTCLHFVTKKYRGGKSKSKSKSNRLLPQLRHIDKCDKKHVYKMKDPQKKRILAINEGIRDEVKQGKTKREAALSKKKRFNVLRQFRKNNDPVGCHKLTQDMKYMDKKYGTGTTNDICKKKGGFSNSKKKTNKKKQFLYNPDDPKKSFDVYIDKDPTDTIPIKYTSVKDVKDTIKKLERLYKQGKYPHKRIWQVGMILYVRLKVLKKKKPEHYQLAHRYFKFLGKRTKIKGETERKKFKFII